MLLIRTADRRQLCPMRDRRLYRVRTGKGERKMEERVYKMVRRAGILNIAVGVVVMVVGIASGILLVIGGSKLLSGKSKILF